MRLPTLLLAAILIVGHQSALSSGAPRPLTFADIQAWAGSDSVTLGFTQDKLMAFLSALKTNLATARQPEWSSWLTGLEQSKNPSLRAWALTRRVESGDFSCYPAFQDAITEHLLGISKPGSGRKDRVIADPPSAPGFKMPDALRIDRQSPFWGSLKKTLLQTPERSLPTGFYAVWCYGTHPDQRDLILELAAHVESNITLRNPHADPWNDPRFWIVLDWAMAWGTRDDFEAIQKALPEGPPRAGFNQSFRAMDLIPGFFTNQTTAEPAKPLAIFPRPAASAMRVGEIPDPIQGPIEDFHFSQIKILDQPPAPRYPEEAKGRKMMTNLVLTLVVDPQGKPISARPVPGPWLGFFAPTGIAYGMRWRFRAAELNGVSVYARFRLTMPFRLR